jgi:E3 ubiquitin-protein ligase HUWE1
VSGLLLTQQLPIPAGVPPLVSRRVLELLTFLARNHSLVTNLLLYFERSVSSPTHSLQLSPPNAKEKGKAKLVEEIAQSEPKAKSEIPLILLLKLLNQPLYLRSSAHLEQVDLAFLESLGVRIIFISFFVIIFLSSSL